MQAGDEIETTAFLRGFPPGNTGNFTTIAQCLIPSELPSSPLWRAIAASGAKVPDQFDFPINYTDGNANLRYYGPDFVALTEDGSHYILETEGLEDVNVVNKDRAAKL